MDSTTEINIENVFGSCDICIICKNEYNKLYGGHTPEPVTMQSMRVHKERTKDNNLTASQREELIIKHEAKIREKIECLLKSTCPSNKDELKSILNSKIDKASRKFDTQGGEEFLNYLFNLMQDAKFRFEKRANHLTAEARKKLVLDNEETIKMFTLRLLKKTSRSKDELESVLNSVVDKATRRFNTHQKQTQFTTYVFKSMQNATYKFWKKTEKELKIERELKDSKEFMKKNKTVPLDNSVEDVKIKEEEQKEQQSFIREHPFKVLLRIDASLLMDKRGPLELFCPYCRRKIWKEFMHNPMLLIIAQDVYLERKYWNKLYLASIPASTPSEDGS